MRTSVIAGSVALCVALLASSLVQAQSGSAAQVEQIDRRVDKLESEMRAVQRKVFPGGNTRFFEPEFPAQPPAGTAQVQPQPPADSAASLLPALQVRVGQLEKQLGELTGRIETSENRVRLLEEQLAKLQGDVAFRLDRLEGTGAAAAGAAPALTPTPGASPAGAPAVPVPAAPAAPAAASTTADAQYQAAFKLLQDKQFAQAEAAFTTWIARHPNHPQAANAQFWLGRTYVNMKDFGKAARAFLQSYQKFPKAERAPDSLLGLGEALTALGNPADACSAYNELQAMYPNAKPEIKTRLAQGRQRAKCQ
jgi:tol-pal system protein YbgF